MTETGSILLVEDDDGIADVVTMNIGDLGFAVERVKNGREALTLAFQSPHALIILDIMLPGMDGLSVCRQVREKDPLVPILILTARSGEIDRVLGLEIGADDYMTKPFSVRELVARVKALLRRSRAGKDAASSAAEKAVIRLGPFIVDFEKRKVVLEGNPIELTVKEFDLLTLLIRNPGKPYSRGDLLKLVWEYGYEGYDHTVNTHINRLRAKIEKDPGNPEYLKTVWGVGYRFAEEGEFAQG